MNLMPREPAKQGMPSRSGAYRSARWSCALLAFIASLGTQAALQEIESDEMLSQEHGEGIAMIMENVEIQAAQPNGTLTAGGARAQMYLNGTNSGARGNRWQNTAGAYAALLPYYGLNLEMVPEASVDALATDTWIRNGGAECTNCYARTRFADIEIGNLDDAAASYTTLARFGNSIWDDPLRMSVIDNRLEIKLPGNLDFGPAGAVMGPDRIPINPNNGTGNTPYGFQAPSGACSPAQAPDGNCTVNKGTVYRFPHEDNRSAQLVINGAAGVNNALAGYTDQELAPIYNWNIRMDMLSTAYAQDNLVLGNGPVFVSQGTLVTGTQNPYYNRVYYGAAPGGYNPDNVGYHRMATLQITGIHSGRTATPSPENPGGLNAIILRAGGLAKAIIMPNHLCFRGDGNGRTAGVPIRSMQLGALNPCLGATGGAVDENDIVTNGSTLGNLTQSQVLVAEGASPANFFNAYPRGHGDYRRNPDDSPALTGGIRGVVEINHLRMDDIRISRSRDPRIDATGNVWPESPSAASAASFRDRELWITDWEARDLRIGSFQIDSTVDQVNHPRNIGGDLYENTSYGNEIAPLSLTFFNDPYNGRTMQLFMPYHNAAAVGNGNGRLTMYHPYISVDRTGGQCCGAVIMDGIQIDYLDVRLFLD